MARSPSSIINFDGWATDLPQWKIFGRTLALALLLPWTFLFLFGIWIAWQTGELMPPAEAARRQAADPSLIWYGYRSSNFARFKLARIAMERPEVLLVGQSRPQSFRSAMFKPYTAYNLGSLSYTLASFTDLLRNLPAGYNPKVIIMSCDYFLFNPVCTEANIKAHMLQDFGPPPEFDPNVLRDVLVTVPQHPALLLAGFRRPHEYPSLGLSAYVNTMGFRYDGSTQWYRESGPDNPNLLQTDPWWTNPLIQGDAMGQAEIAQFEEFVRETRARGIALICVQLPMYGPVVHIMQHEHAEKFGILREFQNRIATGYFNRLGVLVFDYLSFPGYGDDYHYFFDTVHPKEGLDLAVLNAMAADPRFLKILPKLDVADLRQKLDAQRETNHTGVYGTAY